MTARLISGLACAGLLLIFAFPLTKGIINTGNGVGMAFSAILLCIILFWNRFRDLIGRCWEKPLGKLLVSVLGLLAAAIAVLAIVISVFMVKAANDRPRNEDTTLVILGCQVKNGAPSLMLRRRLEAAYEYLNEHENVSVVVSGGKGEDEVISEAQCMRDWLVDNGISSDRIYMEDKSVNTEENLRFSKKIIDDNKLPVTITIVTDGFHQLRADMLAEKQGIEAHNISADTRFYLLPTYWVREWFGIIYYKLF